MSTGLAPTWLLEDQPPLIVPNCNEFRQLPKSYSPKMNERRDIMRTFILSATAMATLAAAPVFAHGHGQSGYGQSGYGQGGYNGSSNQQGYTNVDPNCASERRTSRNVGGFLGALGGASAGRALAAAAVRPEGVILGTVVGAIIGSSVGSAAVDCSPRQLYTQDSGRSYGNTGYAYAQPQAYQQPAYQQPQVRYYPQQQNYGQAPVYQPPVYQQPVYQQPVYQAPQAVYQAPANEGQQVVAGEDWYQPSSASYYGQERRGPLAAAPPAYGRPDYVPSDSYVASQQQQSQVVVTQTYQAGGPVYAQQYAPAPQYAPQPMMMAPQGAPCGYQICR
jgi:hypothetical protein